MAAPIYYTADMLRALPDDGNIYDVLVSPDLFVVPLYWLIDPDAHSVEVWRPDDDLPVTEREVLTWHPSGANEPFTLPLADLFRPV